MPYEGRGERHTATATKVSSHGQIVAEDGIVGSAFKVSQLSRFVDPTTVAATQIAIGEDFEMEILHIGEAPASGNLAAAAKGSQVYINTANNTLGLAAQALAAGNLSAGWLPVGIVTEVDNVRSPAVLRINLGLAHLVRVGTGL